MLLLCCLDVFTPTTKELEFLGSLLIALVSFNHLTLR